jgi:hypothetical protein
VTPGTHALPAPCRVRATSRYALQTPDLLTDAARRTLVRLGVDPAGIGGVLVAREGSGLPDKLVDRAGAEAFTGLEEAGEPPALVAGRLVELVMDGVLELEVGDSFLTGPAAWQELWAVDHGAPRPDDVLARTSYAALAYAERLGIAEPAVLAARLYAYGRVPLSARWARTWPDTNAVLASLGGEDLLDRAWRRSAPASTGWLSWVSVRTASAGRPNDQPPYKLYFSPSVASLPSVLPALAGVLAAAGATRFKVGGDAAGLLRPDKVVAYPADRDELGAVATALGTAFAGVEAHGVPFSAELEGDGLLSWSGDPAADAGPIGSQRESWRGSVTRRLAEYVVAAHAAGLSGAAATGFALDRLELDGVDTHSFLPAGLVPPRLRTAVGDPA